jgi:hypothetical protein
MSTQPRELRARNLRTLAALAALFVLPLLISFWMYYASDWRPAGRVNHGLLISPARPLPEVHLPRVSLGEPGEPQTAGGSGQRTLFRQQWSLVYIGSGSCDESCRQALYVMRQTRLSLNNDMTRVARVFLASGACCVREFLAREHAGLIVLDATGPEGMRLLREFPSAGREHSLFIVDPLGNLMMSYDAGQSPKGLLQDLQKLLRLSHIG